MSNYYEPVIWHQMGTKGHPVLKPKTTVMPVRRREPVMINPRATKFSARHDYGIDDSISRVGYLSNAVLEDTYDAASRSRGRDHELMRNVNAAIPSSLSRDISPTRTGRQPKRYQSLPPVDSTSSSKSTALVPYRNIDKLKSALSSGPSPSSLLSSRINTYLRGSSVPPHPLPRDIASNISYKSLLQRSTPRDLRSNNISYKSFLSDPSVSSPFSTRSSTRFYRPSTLTASYRSSSPYPSRYDTSNNDDYDYGASDDDDYDPDSYKRRYKIIRSPAGSRHHGGVQRIGQPALTYKTDSPAASDDEDEFYDAPESTGTYSCARPSGTSPLKLSSYEGSYDGSYAADMAPMYDYVPFGPSRQGILELTQEEDNTLPSPSTSYLTSPGLTSLPELSSRKSFTPSSLSIVPHVPSSTKHLDDTLTKPSNQMLDSLLSSTAARARQVLKDSNLPEYKNASLVLSVEGSAVSDDGKNRYGFRYYPPPIPLKGSHIGLDERIMGIAPKPVSPADSFLSTYLNRLRDIRSEIRDHVDKGDYARGRSVVPSRTHTPSYVPSYVHRTVDMPVNISGRHHSVPVSSYRSRLDDGQSHRVDVFPLVESETTLPSDRKLHLPMYRAGGDTSSSPNKLTVLDKINIKAAIIGSRMEGANETGRKRKGPRSQFAANKLRELKMDEIEESIYQQTPNTGSLHASRPPLPKMTERKAIRDVDGFTKPRNLLSWQHRVESRLDPNYIIYEPSRFNRMREAVKDVQEKMDRQRQLLDRYLDSDFRPADLSAKTYERGTSAGGDPNNRPVSDLRRRLRRTIARTKNNPEYYRE